jgi:hypothetical protein
MWRDKPTSACGVASRGHDGGYGLHGAFAHDGPVAKVAEGSD